MRTRSTTPADIKPGQIPACGGCLNWDQTLHFFSGCIESVFLFFFPIWGPNAANCCQWQQKWLLKRLCLISYNLLTSSELRCPTNHRGGRQQHACRTSVPLLCIKDETRWQITVARAALNPSIVFQSCCPVICSRRLASASVFGLFNASFTESITFSHKNMTLRARARTCASAGGTGRAGTRESEGDRDGWRNGWMSSVGSIRRACSAHKRTGRRQEEIPVPNATDVGRSWWISRRGIFPDCRLENLLCRPQCWFSSS